MWTEDKIDVMLDDMARRKQLVQQGQMMSGATFAVYQERGGTAQLTFDFRQPSVSIVDYDDAVELTGRLVAATKPIFAEYAKKWIEEALAGATPETDPSPVTEEDKE